jgi:hypothetical protein
MSEAEYETLWHYSEQFTLDKLQRSELVTIAYVQGQRMGKKCTPGLIKSIMHFRAKELNKRSAFSVKDVGKSTRDAWNHERVYLDRPLDSCDGGKTLGDIARHTHVTARCDHHERIPWIADGRRTNAAGRSCSRIQDE